MSKKIDLGIPYRKLYEAYSVAYADKNKQYVQDEVNTLWRNLKSSDNVESEVNSKIKELQIKLTKKKATLIDIFLKNPSSSKPPKQLERVGVKVSSSFILFQYFVLPC